MEYKSLQELIEKLCPEGIDYTTMGALMNREKEKAKSDNSVSTVLVVSNSKGIIPASEYTQRKEMASEDTSNYSIVRKGNFAYNPSRLNVGSFNWNRLSIDGLVSPMYVVFSVDESIVTKEFFYLWSTTNYVTMKIEQLKEEGARFRFNFEKWSEIEIPVPPLPVQEEIVRILDKFTELTAELQANLADELTARKQQYEYYRKKVLKHSDDVEVKPLGELVKVEMCRRIMKNETMSEGEIPFYQNGTLGKKAKLYISRETYEKYKAISRMPSKGCVMLTTAGTLGSTYQYDGTDAFFQDSNVVWLNNDESVISNDYLLCFCDSFPWDIPTRGTLKHLHNYMIEATEIPILSKDIQKKIVEYTIIVNKEFSEMISSLSNEIEARQQQYEYYRDLLLTFKRKDVA